MSLPRSRTLLFALSAPLLSWNCAPSTTSTPSEIEALLDRADEAPDDDLEGLEALRGAALALAGDPGLDDESRARIERLDARLTRARGRRAAPPAMPLGTVAPLAATAAAAAPCLGKDSPADELGSALATGDFDGDGIDDLALGAPGEAHDFDGHSGQVYVYRGTSSGLVPWLRIGQAGLGAAEADDQVGWTLAAGDFDGDGYDDLAVGAPGEAVGAAENAGWVFVFRGGAAGLAPWQSFGQTMGSNEELDQFGATLVAADFNGDGRADLAVGTPGEDTLGATDTGYVWIYRGGIKGLVASQGLHYSGLRPATGDDRFGAALAAGDWHGDGRQDLAVGAPGEDQARGAVYTFLTLAAAPSQLQLAQRLDQTGGGANEKADAFGTALAAGDFDGDGHDELAVGAPGEDRGDVNDGGYVFVFRHGLKGFAYWQSLPPELLVADTASANFGSRLTAARLDLDGRDELVVTREAQTQSLAFFRGGATSLTPWGTRDQAGIAANEPLDWLGWAAVVGDFNGDGFQDVAAGAPWEDLGVIPNAGAVVLYKGQATGSLPPGWKWLSQEVAGCAPTWPVPPTLTMTGRSTTSISIRVDGPPGARALYYGRFGEYHQTTATSATRTFSGLEPDTEYCFQARALGAGPDPSDDTRACYRTVAVTPPPPPPPGPEEHDFTVVLTRTEIWEGYSPYEGTFGPVWGATITGITPMATFFPSALQFVKPGYTTLDCGNPDAVVTVWDGTPMTPAQMIELYGTSTPSGALYFVACLVLPAGYEYPGNWWLTVSYTTD